MKHEESGEGEGRRDRLLAALTLIGGAGFFIAVPFALQAGAEFFLSLAAALVIAITLVPFLGWMERRGMSSQVAALIAVIFFLRSGEHQSELQSLMRNSSAVLWLETKYT